MEVDLTVATGSREYWEVGRVKLSPAHYLEVALLRPIKMGPVLRQARLDRMTARADPRVRRVVPLGGSPQITCEAADFCAAAHTSALSVGHERNA